MKPINKFCNSIQKKIAFITDLIKEHKDMSITVFCEFELASILYDVCDEFDFEETWCNPVKYTNSYGFSVIGNHSMGYEPICNEKGNVMMFDGEYIIFDKNTLDKYPELETKCESSIDQYIIIDGCDGSCSGDCKFLNEECLEEVEIVEE